MSRSRSRPSGQRSRGSRTSGSRTTAARSTASRASAPRPAETRRAGSPIWYLLLLIPYAAMFWVASYNTAEPSWAGIPFFYWYQLLWIWIGSGVILAVHLVVNRGRR